MEELIRLDNVEDYNRLFGIKTLHPLVSVVDLSEATTFPTRFIIAKTKRAFFQNETSKNCIFSHPFHYLKNTD